MEIRKLMRNLAVPAALVGAMALGAGSASAASVPVGGIAAPALVTGTGLAQLPAMNGVIPAQWGPPRWYYGGPPPRWYRRRPPRWRARHRRHVRWCLNRYRTYNPRTNRFIGYDGRRHRCISPFW